MEESAPAEQTQAPKQFKRGKVDLLNGPIDSTLRTFAIPLAFSFLVNMLYSWIDTYFVSRLGSSAIAAIGVSEQLGFFIFNFGSGFAIGTGIIVARRMGEGDRKGANYTATQAVLSMLIFSVSLAVGLYFGLDSVLKAMNLEPEVARLARLYLSALLFGVPGNFLTFQINSIVRSSGNSVFPMMILLMTTVINAILAPILIFGVGPIPALGMTGAGLATAGAQLIGGIISVSMLISGKTGIRLMMDKLSLDLALIWRIAKQGIPASLQMFSVSISRIMLFKFASTFGTSVVAAYTLGLKVDLFVFMTVFAVGIAMETATGQNLGAGNIKRVFLFHRSAMKQVSMVIAVLATGVFLFGDHFAGIFTKDAAIIKETTRYLHTAVFGYIFFGVGLVTTRVISGAGASFRSMIIVGGSLIFLQVPLAYSLSHFTGLGPQGIWFGVVGGYILFTGIAFIELTRKKWLNARV
ncbi:MAG: MATE family efflux transporter [Candidatus Kapaibacterium sp.]